MTREEFLSKKADSERQIRRSVIPFGLIYSIRLVSPVCIIVLAVLLAIHFGTAARKTILFELLFCVLLFGITFPVERDGRKRFARLGLRCPSCQSYLIFTDGKKVAETGRCPHCGALVFDS
jgi:hypothetical protein